jgi:hypothetical protein
MAGQACPVCSKPIEPGDGVSFQHGQLMHLACRDARVRVQPEQRETVYRGVTIVVDCNQVGKRWRPLAVIRTAVGPVTLRGELLHLYHHPAEALAAALDTARHWIDKTAGPGKAR